MRIVRYHPRAAEGDGGITGSVRRWSAALAGAGAETVIAFDRGTPPLPEPGVEWEAVRHTGKRGWRVPAELERVLEGADLLVLHSGWTLHNARAGEAARRMRVPYLLEPRGAYDPAIVHRRPAHKRLWWWTFERRLVRGAAAIHVFFPEQAGHLARLGWRGPVVDAPNGVAAPARARWDGSADGWVLWYGRFDPEAKGLEVLLRGMARLRPAERPPLRLHGPDWHGGTERTRRLVEELGLGESVTLGPPVYGAEKWELLSGSRGFVYPSRWEGFGNAAAEAVAAGVPTLVTPYPLGRFLAERGAALLAEATPEGLAEGVRRLRAPEAAEVARRGARLIAEELSWDRVARRWLEQVRALV